MDWILSTEGFLLLQPENFYYYLFGGIAIFLALGFTGAHLLLWTLFFADILWGCSAGQTTWIVFGVFATIFNLPPLRQNIVSRHHWF